MWVQLLGTISGTRDGQEWPPRFSKIELPDEEALGLISNQMARPVVPDEVERAVLDDPAVEIRGTVTESEADAAASAPATGLTTKSVPVRTSRGARS